MNPQSWFLIDWFPTFDGFSTNEKPGFIFPHSLNYLSSVLESVNQMLLGSVRILSDSNFLSFKAQGMVYQSLNEIIEIICSFAMWRKDVLPCMYPDTNNLFVRIVEEYDFVAIFGIYYSRNEAMINLHNLFLQWHFVSDWIH